MFWQVDQNQTCKHTCFWAASRSFSWNRRPSHRQPRARLLSAYSWLSFGEMMPKCGFFPGLNWRKVMRLVSAAVCMWGDHSLAALVIQCLSQKSARFAFPLRYARRGWASAENVNLAPFCRRQKVTHFEKASVLTAREQLRSYSFDDDVNFPLFGLSKSPRS